VLEERLAEETQKRGSAELRAKLALLDAPPSASNTPGARSAAGTVPSGGGGKSPTKAQR